MSKKEKVLKGLFMCISTPFSPCDKCPYQGKPCCFTELYEDAVKLIKERK